MIGIISTSILTTVLITVVFLILILFLISALKKDDKKSIKQKKAKTVLISDIDISYDKKNETLFSKQETFFDFNNKLKAIVDDKRIEKVIIDVDKFSLTTTQFEELEETFRKMREKKEVIAIGSVFTNESYLTSLLASKIYMVKTNNAYLMIQGYKKKLPYYKKFLDKLGIEVRIFNVGDFKSYGENYKLDKMSDNLAISLTKLADDKLDYFINKVMEYRKVDIKDSILDGNIFLKNDYKGLIDDKVHKYEHIEKDEKIINIKNYNIKTKKKKIKDEIALISLEGSISEKGINFDEVYTKVQKALELDNLRALILEINSPGGSAYESSLIHSMLKKELKGIPIFVSMKDVCASGGYFIASSAIKIFANENTVTGSIGVVAMYPNVKKLAEKIGINYSGVTKGETLEFSDFTEELREKTESQLQNQIEAVYDEFKRVVIKSRIMSDERLEKIAGGRVYTGKMAKANNLVDDILNLDGVIEYVKKYLKLSSVKVVQIEKEIKLMQEVKSKIPLLSIDTKLLNTPLMLYIEN